LQWSLFVGYIYWWGSNSSDQSFSESAHL